MGCEEAAMIALITGAGGFLGGAIVRRLLEHGCAVRTLQRGHYPWLEQAGARCFRADLTDEDAVLAATQGCDAVFHVAAKAGVWGSYRSYLRPNVIGTRNVIQACHRHRVRKLIFTSSPSVTFAGRDENGIDESAPYPDHYLAHYPATKAIAERMVLDAAGDELATVALRPHLIWGPDDSHLVPRIIERARAGRLRIVGSGDNLVDSTYIDNAAAAHLAACDRLAPGAPCTGRAYFISNGQPLPMRDLINRILAAAHLPPATRHISPRIATAAGGLLEGVHHLLRIRREPVLTRFVARQLACAHWYDLGAARRDLGYEPLVSIDEGMRRLERSLAEPSP
jgi:nucleoside-diphosphate-sugar epimerase